MDKLHTDAVGVISGRVKSFYDTKRPFRVYHGSTNTTRSQSNKRRDQMVDVSALDRVMKIDVASQTAIVEPNVPMDQLVAATLKHGLVPPVVMEFPGITVGGGLQGGAGESSSFKWGCFNRTLNWYEVVTGDGTVVKASRTEHSDLYYASPGAYGSLGVVTAAEVQLVPAKAYVALEYLLVRSFDEAVQMIDETKTTDPDYIDGIMFAQDRGVVMIGRMIDQPAGRTIRYRRPRDPWFYLRADQISQAGKPVTEYVPLVDYLFRYDRGAFWTGKYSFERFGVPFNKLTRFVFDPFFKTRRMYVALEASGLAQEYLVQDLALPADRAGEFMNWTNQNLGIYPLWLCPLAVDTDSRLQSNYLPAKSIMNVGVWGPGPTTKEAFVTANRRLEAEVSRLGGRKWLYAHAYYPEAEFWKMYDYGWYQSIRSKYHAQTLPTVFDKTHVSEHEWVRVSGKRGVWRALIGAKRPR